MPRTRTLAAAGLLAMFALAPLYSSHAASSSPKKYALRSSDVPKTYHQTVGKFISNAQMAQQVHITKALFDKHGRIQGYESGFAPSTGVAVIASAVFVYKTSAGADWDFSQSVRHDLAGAKRVSVPKIGDESTAYTASEKDGALTLVVYGVDFRQGNVDTTVGLVDVKGKASLGNTVYYARVVDAREKRG